MSWLLWQSDPVHAFTDCDLHYAITNLLRCPRLQANVPTLEAQKQPLRQHIVVCCVPQLLAQRSAPIILVSISQQTSSRVARQFASFQNRCMGNGPSRACRPGLVKAASSLVFSQATVRPEIGPRAWREDGDITRGLACTYWEPSEVCNFPNELHMHLCRTSGAEFLFSSSLPAVVVFVWFLCLACADSLSICT